MNVLLRHHNANGKVTASRSPKDESHRDPAWLRLVRASHSTFTSMNDLAHVLLGAAFVTIGVLVAALADRIRGVRVTRVRAPCVVASNSRPLAPPQRDTPATADDVQARAVIGALVTAGFSKRVAAAATTACAREQRATVETWTRAALRHCSYGGAT